MNAKIEVVKWLADSKRKSRASARRSFVLGLATILIVGAFSSAPALAKSKASNSVETQVQATAPTKVAKLDASKTGKESNESKLKAPTEAAVSKAANLPAPAVANSKTKTGAAGAANTRPPSAADLVRKTTTDDLAFTVRQESYLNRDKPPAGIPDYSQIGAHFRTETEGRTLVGTLELGGSFATAVESYTNIYVPEANLSWRTSSWDEGEVTGDLRGRVSVGRKKESWSLLDQNWGLGLWQPLNRFDSLRPIDQGLTGVFLEAGSGNAKLIGFMSSVYIPEQGPNFSLQNGKIRSSNPWFVEPSDRLILFSESTSIQYDIRTPSVGSVINHMSGGFLARYGELERGAYVQGSYVFKPRNQLAIPFEAALDLTDTTSFASVSVQPLVVYHQLVGFDAGYSNDVFHFGVSALADLPMNENPGANYTYQELNPMYLVSPKLDGEFDIGVDLNVGVSYLKALDGSTTTLGRFASEKAVFGPRLPWKDAALIGAKVVTGKGQRTTWSFGAKWLEDFAEQGSLLMADAAVDFAVNASAQKDWQVSLMADVLGSRKPGNQNEGYVSQYRSNDRVMSQLRFVF